MDKKWAEFDNLTNQCYTDMITNVHSMKNWNKGFRLLTKIVTEERKNNPEFAREWYLLDDSTDFIHDVQGWMDDYLGELEIRGMSAEIESVCRKVLELFDWKEESPSYFYSYLDQALSSQGKEKECLEFSEKWVAAEPDNPYAAACLINIMIRTKDLKGAEEMIRKYISDDTECTEDNDVVFAAAVNFYQATGDKAMAKKMDDAREEYDRKLGEYLMGMDEEDSDFLDDELPFA